MDLNECICDDKIGIIMYLYCVFACICEGSIQWYWHWWDTPGVGSSFGVVSMKVLDVLNQEFSGLYFGIS